MEEQEVTTRDNGGDARDNVADACDNAANKPSKTNKKVKKLHTDIKNQMEFYFSDANLNKDRFLKKLIKDSKDGYVDLQVFSKFNKIKTLTDDINALAQALADSSLIQVSNDHRRVRRNKPLPEPTNVDERTVYVECLPLKADHVWVKQRFEQFGNVVYVSIPKYKTTRDSKGFAFVEFETVEAAKKACEMCGSSGAADKLGLFPRYNKQMKSIVKQLKIHDNESRDPRLGRKNKRHRTVSESAAGDETKVTKARKRVRTTSEGPHIVISDQPEPISAKRAKISTDDKDTNLESEFHNPNIEEMKQKPSETDSESEPENEAPHGTKKVRIADATMIEISENKKSKTKKWPKKKGHGKLENPELRVIPKEKWLSLKTEYLQLQKASMTQLKKTLRDHIVESIDSDPDAVSDAIPFSNSVENMDTSEGKKAEKKQIEFTPNVIVQIKGKTPLNRKDVKEHVSKNADVTYVDVKEGATEGFIRCPDAENATKLTSITDDLYTYSLLQGQEESQYWAKIQADREQKLNVKVKPKRGRDKIFKKAERILDAHQKKHIVFDDD